MLRSCCGSDAFTAALTADIESVLICGLETHVCIQQTALDLLARGLTVFIAVDAVASRHTLDHEIALRRLESSGAILTTTECGLNHHQRVIGNHNGSTARAADGMFDEAFAIMRAGGMDAFAAAISKRHDCVGAE